MRNTVTPSLAVALSASCDGDQPTDPDQVAGAVTVPIGWIA